MADNISQDLKSGALFYHRYPRPGKARDPGDQAARQPARPGARLFARRRRAPAGHRRRPGARPRTTPSRGNLVAVDLQRHRRARPRRYRPARLQAGDGRQGGPVQEIRRHRRLRHRGRRRTNVDRFVDVVAALEPTFGGINLEDIKAPGMLRDRGAAARRGWRIPVFHDDQHGTAIIVGAAVLNGLELAGKQHRRRQDRHLRRRRGGARLPQSPRLARRQAREHLGHRHRGRGL